MSNGQFKVISRLSGDVAIVAPQGYLNNLAGESLVRECRAQLESGIRKIVLDFSGVDVINSIGISFLLTTMEELRSSQATLCFTSMNARHRDTFEMLGLARFLKVFETEDSALQYLHGEGKSHGA